MKKQAMLAGLSITVLFLFLGGRALDEGMWLLDTIGSLPLSAMKAHGLELTPEQIYNPSGPSLKDAIVLLGGGTSSFVSADGLMMTNHHVAFAGIQSLSSVKDDYLKNGFWAKSRSEELPTTYTAQVVTEIREVTREVLSAVQDTMSAEQRARAIQTRSQEIERTAKGTTDLVCRVSEMYSGVKYYLFTMMTLNDVRLVYAPPSAIGNYGGEVDNWMWPRHTGDFSLMRAYVGPDGTPAKHAQQNVPFHPKVFLPISTHGYEPGSFAMIMGFPGRTFRYREASAVELARDESLPATVDLYRTRIAIIEQAGHRDRAVEIKYASRLRGLANTYKNYLGTLEGMRRSHLLELKTRQEADFTSYLGSRPELQTRYGSLLPAMAQLNAEQRTIARKSILLTNLATGVDILRLASRFRAYAEAGALEKDRPVVRDMITATFKNFDIGVEKATLTALILKAAALPAGQQLEALRETIGSARGAEQEEKAREFVNDLYEESALPTPEGALQLLERSAEKILKDDYVAFARRIDAEQAPVTAQMARLTAQLGQLRGRYIEALLGWKKDALIYPDANRTLRFSYGTVKPYVPRDAVEYGFMTTLTGVMEKETGAEPFIVPPRLKELWTKKDFGPYKDARTGDIPVAFIADLDITGGNSGSPVINGRGELIGCAFDGNWEAVVGDYLFQEPLNRTISVDMRYVLFVLDKFSGARNVLSELVIR